MRILKTLPVLFVAAAVFSTTGCSNEAGDSVEDLVITSTTPGDVPDNGEILAEPKANFNDNRMEIVYTNAGSGSCQPLLTSAVLNTDTETVVLTVSDEYGSPGTPCTDDLTTVKQIVRQEDGSPFSEETIITFNE